jgi:acyl-CoA synthetase (AMP-forming)/AMP-acid ligase II/acyl carrier protein
MTYTNTNSLFETLQQAAIRNRLFAHIGDKKTTYGQLLEEIEKLWSIFQKNGLKKGDKVILSVNDDYYTALFFLAFLRYGIVTVFIDPDVPPKRAIAIIEKTGANIFVMDEELFVTRLIDTNSTAFHLKIQAATQKKGKLFERLLKNKNVTPAADEFIFPAIMNASFVVPQSIDIINDEDIAYILFTSGTTSDPRGVMISHGNLFAHLHTLKKVYGINEDDRLLNILMLYHADGIIQGPLLTAFNQATWIRPFRFDLSTIGDLFNSIYKYRITHFITVPTVLSFMNKFHEGYEDSFQTDHFKFIISVASKLELKLWQDFEQKFQTRLVNVYGLTETVAGSLFCGVNELPRKIGTVGIPVDCEAKIIKEDGEIAQANETGVLWLKGAHIFKGYLNNPIDTQNVLVNGWLNTGDIAVKDEDGFFYITGREKNTINTGGINIYPEQVTEMINTHPKVVESICLGLPDENFQERLVGAIVVKANESLDKNELIIFLRPLLEQSQLPKNYYFFPDLPKGLSGKIQVNAVKELILSKENDGTGAVASTSKTTIMEAAAEAFGIDVSKVKMSDTSHTLEGWDSMAHLVFITILEDRLKVRFSTAEMMNMNMLTSVERIINEKLKAV